MVLRCDLTHVNEIKNLNCQSRIFHEVFRFSKTACSFLLLPELMLPFRARDFLLALALAALPQVAIQRSSMSLV